LGGAIGQRPGFPSEVIKRNNDSPIQEKGQQPIAELGRETQKAKKMDSTVPANVVKEALDIKKESRNRRASTNALLCRMHQGEGSVNGTMFVPRTELVLREEVVCVNVREDTRGDNLLQPFAAAFQKGSRCFQKCCGQSYASPANVASTHHIEKPPILHSICLA